MFRALLCPSSEAHYCSADYHMGRLVIGLLLVGFRCRQAGYVTGLQAQPGHLSSLPAPNFQPTTTQEPDGPCGNQHYNRELLMMGIVVPETY